MSSPEMANFNHPFETYKKPKKIFKKKITLFLAFAIIVGLLLITTIYKNTTFPAIGNITGKVIGIFSKEANTENYFKVSMNLTIPELELKDDYQEIVIKGNSNTPLRIGNSNIEFKKEGTTEIILKEFSGKINLNEEGINYLDGEVIKATINQIPISNIKDKKIDISTNSILNYELIEFKEEIKFKKLKYSTSGNILLKNENALRLNNEEIEIINFIGKITIKNNVINFEGLVENIKSKNFKLK